MSRRRGMTLIEVMLALSLFAMLSIFVLSVVNSVLGLWQSGERRGNGDLAFSSLTASMRIDLSALHTGPSGWLILDQYQAWPEEDSNPAWMLPRLRFLARGASLPVDDPSGRASVEIAWVAVPVDPENNRLTRLVRLTQLAGDTSLASDRHLSALLQAGNGVPMMEGVAFLDWQMFDLDGQPFTYDRVDAGSPFDFPAEILIDLERVSPESQQRPLVLDEDVGPGTQSIIVRGTPPLRVPSHLMMGVEWVEVQGQFPRLRAVTHGARDTAPRTHHRGDPVLAPVAYQSRFHLASQGRRMMP
jgi:prepilin-type N-terminal cleavage/methylation domain-containing protein